MKKQWLFPIIILVVVMLLLPLFVFDIIPEKTYTNEDFGIKTYKSEIDFDGDGIDDQTDILQSVRKYIATNPKYKSKYYSTGYPNDEFGVCTDVVAQGFLGAGYDLMRLVNDDIKSKPDTYNVEKVDINIDFRRVVNLKKYFDNNAHSLTTDISKIQEWQGGDIVVFPKHIAVVSNKRNKNGIPYIIHHANPYQRHFEEDVLERYDEIVGHYRVK